MSRDDAHFFTTDQEHAESFGLPKAFYLSIQNPLEISDDDLYAEWDKEHPSGEQDDRFLLPRHFVGTFVRKAKEQGYDGLIVRDMGDRDINTDMYLPFLPSQIKSATDNNGLYDLHCDDFTDQSSPLVLDGKMQIFASAKLRMLL